MPHDRDLVLRRVRAHGRASDAIPSRLWLDHSLQGVSERLPGVEPEATLLVRNLRHLRRPPGRRAGSGSPQLARWRGALREQLSTLARDGTRPARGPVPASAPAVVFADDAELLACLASDWLAGVAADRWWWRALRDGDDLTGDLAGVWAARPRHVPAALAMLAGRDAHVAFVQRIGAHHVGRLTRELAGAWGLPWLADAAVRSLASTGAGADGEDADGADVVTRRGGRSVATAPWQAIAPEVPAAGLNAGAQLLLGIGLMLARAPAIACGSSTPAQVTRWLAPLGPPGPGERRRKPRARRAGRRERRVHERVTARDVRSLREPEPPAGRMQVSVEQPEGAHGVGSASPAPSPEIGAQEVLPRSPPAPPESKPAATGSDRPRMHEVASDALDDEIAARASGLRTSSGSTPGAVTAAELVSGDRGALEAADGPAATPLPAHGGREPGGRGDAAPAAHPAEVDVQTHATPRAIGRARAARGSTATPLRSRVDNDSSPPGRIASAPVIDRPAAPTTRTVSTELGGIFYLLQVALRIGHYGDFTAPGKPGLALSPWDWLTLVAEHLLAGRRMPRRPRPDPIWSLLAELAGRLPADRPARGFRAPRVWRVPPAWLAALPADRRPWSWSMSDERLVVRHPLGFSLLDLPARGDPQHALKDELHRYGPHRTSVGIPGEHPPQPPASWKLPPGLSRWRTWTGEYVEARLRAALGLSRRSDAGALVLRNPAQVRASAERVDVWLSLDRLPVAIRVAGLDLDPGWIPATGRVVAFHYEW